MTANAYSYFNDGANAQAQAVLAYMAEFGSNVEESWDSNRKDYLARPEVSRFHNCREQGYIITMPSKGHDAQINIIFFEHRNSDNICVVHWEGMPTINPPTIDSIPNDVPWKHSKYDYNRAFSHGQAADVAKYIDDLLNAFWKKTA